VLEALADRASNAIRVHHFRREGDVRKWALAFPKRQIESALTRSLGEAVPAPAIVDFLTWRPGGYKGLWGKPLATVPGEPAVSSSDKHTPPGSQIPSSRTASTTLRNSTIEPSPVRFTMRP
jgi:hypothetical protein